MNFSAKKSLGQNFLIDQKMINLITEVGDINSKDIVLVVGPGTGNLTEKILEKKPKDFILIEKVLKKIRSTKKFLPFYSDTFYFL